VETTSDTSFNSNLSSSTTKQTNEFKSCEIYINCDTRWDELQIIVSRSTTTDPSKMTAKLQEFLDQQHRSGIRALYKLHQLSEQSSGRGYSSSGPMSSLPEETDGTADNESGMSKFYTFILF